jgi:hypothetical protein
MAIVKYGNGSDWQFEYANVIDNVTGAVYRCSAVDAADGFFPTAKTWKYFGCGRV